MVEETLAEVNLVATSTLVEETLPKVFCPALLCKVPPIVTFPVVEAFAIEVEAFKVRTPVEETKERRAEEEVLTPRMPKRI